jgi:hypothetical protein
MSTDPDGAAALRGLDLILAARPRTDGAVLTEATQRLCRFRKGLIDEGVPSSAAARDRLSRLNAILSVVAGVHFPLGGVPWNELEKARGWLADLLDEVAAQV